jgi:iron complex outermembrane receptor protein
MRTPFRPRAVLAVALLSVLPLAGTVAADATGAAAADAAAAASAAAPSDAAPAPAAATESTTKNEQLQTVIVYGMTANLEKSLDIKRNAPVVLDSISSVELGRFPDADVGDALAHLPGITLQRTTGGEGQKVWVRGLGPQYNIITLKNRIIASDDDGRDIAFDVLPAELIIGADVLKSPQASAVEGSIGGTVNLRTASAFDNPGLHFGAHAEGNYNDLSQLHGNKISVFVSNTILDDRLGFVLGGVHSDDNIRTDSLNAYNQTPAASIGGYGPSTYPFAGGPGSVPLIATPCCITFGSIFDDKKRDALTGSLEWRPNSAFQLTLDGLWTRLNDPQIGYNQSYYFAAPDSTGFNSDGTPWATNVVAQNGIINSLTVGEFQPEMVNNTTNRKVDTYLFGLNAGWKPNEHVSFGVDAYRSAASRPEGGQDTFVTAGLVNDSPTAEDILNFTNVPHSLPNINVVVPPSQLGLSSCPAGAASSTNPGYCSYTALMNSGFLNNNKYWSTHYVGLNGYSVHDTINGITLDGAWNANHGVFERLLFGVGYTDRKKDRDDSSNDWTNGSGQYGTLYQTQGCPSTGVPGGVQCYPYSFASQGFNVISMANIPNFMRGAGGSYPGVVPQLNVSQLFAFLKSLDGKLNPLVCPGPSCAPFDFAQTLPQPNPYNSYAVTEKTSSFYVQGDFSADRWSGNLGVRVVRTQTTANTATTVPVAIWTQTTGTTTQTWNVVYGTSQPLGATGDYTLALPSLNVAYWAVPNELQLRLSVAETMSRPNLDQLAPTSTNNAINGPSGNQLTYSGTAGLKPVKANQADLSVEWYYAEHSALTAAAFYKKLRNDIYTAVAVGVDLGTKQYQGGPPGTVPGTPLYWTVSSPANGTENTVSGIELIWQHIMENGFGTRMQYTATRTRSYDQYGVFVGAINAAPPTTWSLSLLYDKGPWSADVTWDHQSSFTVASRDSTEIPGWPAISDAFDWVTASLHYRFGKGWEVFTEGKNLSNSVARSYLNGNPLLPWAPGQSIGQSQSGTGIGYSSYGRTYVLGIAYTR